MPGLTHRNSEHANANLHARQCHENGLDAACNNPIESFKGKAKRKKILEDEEASKAFDGHVT